MKHNDPLPFKQVIRKRKLPKSLGEAKLDLQECVTYRYSGSYIRLQGALDYYDQVTGIISASNQTLMNLTGDSLSTIQRNLRMKKRQKQIWFNDESKWGCSERFIIQKKNVMFACYHLIRQNHGREWVQDILEHFGISGKMADLERSLFGEKVANVSRREKRIRNATSSTKISPCTPVCTMSTVPTVIDSPSENSYTLLIEGSSSTPERVHAPPKPTTATFICETEDEKDWAKSMKPHELHKCRLMRASYTDEEWENLGPKRRGYVAYVVRAGDAERNIAWREEKKRVTQEKQQDLDNEESNRLLARQIDEEQKRHLGDPSWQKIEFSPKPHMLYIRNKSTRRDFPVGYNIPSLEFKSSILHVARKECLVCPLFDSLETQLRGSGQGRAEVDSTTPKSMTNENTRSNYTHNPRDLTPTADHSKLNSNSGCQSRPPGQQSEKARPSESRTPQHQISVTWSSLLRTHSTTTAGQTTSRSSSCQRERYTSQSPEPSYG